VIVLVRHAEAVAPSDSGYEENDRPLAGAGRRDSEQLADELSAEAVAAIYSSPYPRAVQTVEPLARRLGAEISLVDDLRERLLSLRALPDWRERLQLSWKDFGYALEDGESSAEAQRRVTDVLATLRRRHLGTRIVVASHGNLIALGLHAIVPDQVTSSSGPPCPRRRSTYCPATARCQGPDSATEISTTDFSSSVWRSARTAICTATTISSTANDRCSVLLESELATTSPSLAVGTDARPITIASRQFTFP
jgi:2,3-bisphosphoglycerate-dependent phosphoglycerate mutase